MTTVTGIRALEKRLAAIGDTRSMLRALQIATVSEAQVMAWPSSRTRLSGRSRTRRGKAIAGMAFATSTKGMKAKPYLIPGAKAALGKSGGKDVIVTRWNRAA
jgi:hypothetical protein